MTTSSRRDFIRHTSTGLATCAIAAGPLAAAKASRRSPAEVVRLALIGCGGRGHGLAGEFHRLNNTDVVAVCDPDEERLNKTAAAIGEGTRKERDMRRVLEDKSIDGVVIATPDHWHAPAAMLALEADKHVYVEKPCCHNLNEGRALLDLSRRSGLHVQHGTQSRSVGWIAHAMQLLRDGAIGDVLMAKAWNVQRRNPIGKAQPSEPPAGLDYDLWIGPAPMVPFQSNRAHYTWHWWYDFGTGDTGNDGVHELDIARWGLGVDAQPDFVSACGGKYAYDDDQQFPDTQYVSFDWNPESEFGQRRQMVFEMRLWSRYGLESVDNGNAFYGTNGWMFLTKRGRVRLFDERNNEREMPPVKIDLPNHAQNFVSAVRGEAELTAPVTEGHLSASLCHLANISTRLGRSLEFDRDTEQFAGDEEANQLLSRTYREGHWAVPKNLG